MKYRIAQRVDGTFIVQRSNIGFIWKDWGHEKTLEGCKNRIKMGRKNDKEEHERILGSKITKYIKVDGDA